MVSAVVPFVGPSYTLSNRKADTQRTVNMYLRKVESGSGKAQFILKSIPGLEFFSNLDGAFRGVATVLDGRVFAVAGDDLVEVLSDGSITAIPLLTTSSGLVSMAYGREHLVIADGSTHFYYSELATDTLFDDTDASYTGSDWVVYIAGRFVFGKTGTDQFIWTDIDAPGTIDPLDFATAESSPDGLVWGVKYREELWLFGTSSTEVWRSSDSADAAFEKNQGVSISIGCAAKHTVCAIDNSLFWVGQDESGGAVVYMAQGYSPRRVSNHAVEEALQGSTNISAASAYCYQMDGSVFVCINAPGLDTTWCYDINTGTWHERAELVDGEYEPHRAVLHAFAFGNHLVGTDDGFIYRLDNTVFKNGEDVLCRERTSPHYATAQFNEVFYSRLRLDCSVGTIVDGPKYVELYYSDDGGYTWTDSALQESLGETGERRTMLQWNRLGKARDRVWRLRCTDDVLFDIVSVDVQAEEGAS